MILFESDYNNGMLPEIIENLSKTNDDKTSGYGFDEIWEKKNEQEIVCRFVTSWATKEEELEELDKAIEKCMA